MFNIVKKELNWCGRTLTLETGRIARQADGAVLASCGDTQVLCTAVSKKEASPDIDFFPLTIHYQEKAFAAGKIPGGFFKREGRPAEKEVLTSRLIDRPIRPLFPESFFNDTQVICTVLSHDMEVDPDIIAMVGASAALSLSGVPFQGPIAGMRVGYVDGKYVGNPSKEELENSDLDLVVAGTDAAVLMVESEAKVLSEEVMLGAVEFGHKEMQPVIKLIKELKKDAGNAAWGDVKEDNKKLYDAIAKLGEKDFRAAYKEQEKQTRVEKLNAVRDAILSKIAEEQGEEFNEKLTNRLIKKLEKNIVRGDIIKNTTRIDGRTPSDVRPIVCEVGVLPKTHGSALFTRGETQALVVTTLGTNQDMQIIDALDGDYKEHFMLHYNFPPYSVGESSMLRPPGRREIGHGKLAWRALRTTLPNQEDFPYTIRNVSEITESNGSSSMATVCGTSLAMMDAGVPLSNPTAGIAMGLIKEDKDFVVLSDILGDEDHLGDMDFKVAGTKEGITALQMDIKINGITTEIMKQALAQAKDGRLHILGEMDKALTGPREAISGNAPQIVTIKINKEKIGGVIGPGGKTIREICETSGAKVDIEEDGSINVAASDRGAIDAAIQMIEDIALEPEAGKIYQGTVTRILDFGAIVAFMGKKEGLVHISEVTGERIETVDEHVNEGDAVKVKVLSVDSRSGKIRLSMCQVDQETGEDLGGNDNDNRGGKGDKGGRNNDRGDRNKGRGGDKPKGKKQFF